MKKITLRDLFKYSNRTNEWYMNYKGMPINISNDEFEEMSDEGLETYIKNRTEQKIRPEPRENILPFEQGLKEFQKGKDRLTFLKFYNSRK
jgi:hypothetical protein